MFSFHSQPALVPVSRRSLRTGISLSTLKLCRLFILSLLLAGNISHPKAQGAYFWSEKERIPEYINSTEEPPYLIADQNHTIHAFNGQPLDLRDGSAPKAIVYRQWTIENGWSYPNDILYDIDGYTLNVVGVVGDQVGRVHLLVQKNGGIYYVQNYLSQAGDATSWPIPLLIAGNTTNFGPGFEIVSAIATDPTGEKIVVIFSGREYGNGLYFTSSQDSGLTWTEPYPIYITGDETVVVTDPKLFYGTSGKYHAVWTSFLGSGGGGPGYYSNFNFESESWSESVELDTPGIRTPSVIEYDGRVIVSYYHENINGNWWRLSNDGGLTWTYPDQVAAGHVGTTGQVSFVVDSSNTLHAFFGNRINDANHGIWHCVWRNNNWTSPEAVVRGPEVRDGVGGDGFGPRSARAIVSQGNVLLVAWGTDGFQGPNGAWFSYRRIDTPELPTVPLVLSENSIERTPTVGIPVVAPQTESETPEVNLEDMGDESSSTVGNPQSQILIGVVPVLLLILGLLLVRIYNNNSRP